MLRISLRLTSATVLAQVQSSHYSNHVVPLSSLKLHYDKLVLATGSQGSTFGIPGVTEHTHFLRDIHQARRGLTLREGDSVQSRPKPHYHPMSHCCSLNTPLDTQLSYSFLTSTTITAINYSILWWVGGVHLKSTPRICMRVDVT